MCGRFAFFHEDASLGGFLDVDLSENIGCHLNIAPSMPVATIVFQDRKRSLSYKRWGLIPSWVKDPAEISLLFNARVETVLQKPSFRDAVCYGRCLIPASGFYEWQKFDTHKTPYFLCPEDGTPFAFAGISTHWMGQNGEEMESVAILTGAAEKGFDKIHPRVPLIVGAQHYESWLDCQSISAEEALKMLEKPSSDQWHISRIDHNVNKVKGGDFDPLKGEMLEWNVLSKQEKSQSSQMSFF